MSPTVPEPTSQNAAQQTDNDTSNDSIWSSILKGVSSFKTAPTKNVLVLGDPSAGKTTLIQALKRDHQPILKPPSGTLNTSISIGTDTMNMDTSKEQQEEEKSELALSYTYSDITDDENDIVGRLGYYQLSASHPTLMKFAFNAHTLPDTLIIIALDWERPWTFIESLQRWFKLICDALNDIREEGRNPNTKWSKGGVVIDEACERLERFLQEYKEPTEDGVAPSTLPVSTDDVLLQLPEGTLVKNLGVPIIVVCCKSDNMNILEKEHDYKEEHFDFIQQALRIICLHYGAALFYTSTHRPRTTALLRAYILSRLLHSTHSSAPMSARFPFNYRAQIIERDTIMIPAGWDSWGKVQALREDFECRVMADAWQIDESNSTEAAENGLHAIYRKRVRDTTATIKSVATKEPVVAEDEQEFLARLREMLQSSSITEKTSAHSISTTTTTTTTTTTSTSTLLGRLPFTVGEAGGEQRSEANDNPMSRLTELAHSRLMSSSANSATSPTSASSPPSQNEVLASFFQSLLTKKSGSSAASSRAKKVAESLARTKNNQ